MAKGTQKSLAPARKAHNGLQLVATRPAREPRLDGEAVVKRLLVIDDHVDARVVLEEFFGAHGFEVSVAKDGREALALLRGGIHYDLLILDLMMPRVDGFEFLESLQKLPKPLSTLPVVVLSAVAPPTLRGAAAAFRKPAPLTQLLETVTGLVGPSTPPVAPLR